MKNYTYQNHLISKKQLRQLLAQSFRKYDSMQACYLADELKYLGFKYATNAGISISIEDLRVPFIKNLVLQKASQEILNSEKVYLKGKITDVERFQKIIDTWSLTSESLKDQVVYYFTNYDPLNSVYIMAFSGARGNLSQVRQLVGMRGLMSDPSGEIMNLPIKKNFREGLTITDYLMSGYGARKGIVDTALKTANSGYLTRRLIDVAQDILIREKDCGTKHSFRINGPGKSSFFDTKNLLGRVLSKSIIDLNSKKVLLSQNSQITPNSLLILKKKNISHFYIRSPFTCSLYRAICQKCYGWDIANESLIDIGEAIGILAGQSIGEPGTQLTMRTFHTGGIFTSEARQQIISPCNGILQYYKLLKTIVLRTNRGEDVLVTKTTGSLVLIPEKKSDKILEISLSRNTILFPKNNQFILRGTVIGELINTNKQVRTEVKSIISNESGEIFSPKLKNNINVLNQNQVIWVLFGQLYNSPKSSFINFYPDYKLNRNSYIFRTKIVSHHNSSVDLLNDNSSIYQRKVGLLNKTYLFPDSNFSKLNKPLEFSNAILNIQGFKYLVNLKVMNNCYYLKLTRNKKIGTLISRAFLTNTAGSIFYDYRNTQNLPKNFKEINYYRRESEQTSLKPIQLHKTISWINEEFYKVNCEPNLLFVKHGDVISKDFELLPGLFAKTSGLVLLEQENQLVLSISIKSGTVYKSRQLEFLEKEIYYPGETILSNITATTISFCEHMTEKKTNQFLVRPIYLYELSYSVPTPINLTLNDKQRFTLDINPTWTYLYKPNKQIYGSKHLILVSNTLSFKTSQLIEGKINIQLIKKAHKSSLNVAIEERLNLINYLPAQLKYKKLVSCFLVQPNQFISRYTTIGYLESIIKDSLEIVKIKVKQGLIKQLLLISNNDCLIVPKNQLPKKQVSDFVLKAQKIEQSGQIIIENNNVFTIQKGRPYFFPNCSRDKLAGRGKFYYKFIPSNVGQKKIFKNRAIFLNYQDISLFSVSRPVSSNYYNDQVLSMKTWFTKLFIKTNGKLYSCLLPQFFKKISIISDSSNFRFSRFIQPSIDIDKRLDIQNKVILVQSSTVIKNKYIESYLSEQSLLLLSFSEQPFTRATKAIGLCAITEDLIDQETNDIFCRNNEFIESGKVLGLLNLEKEITGDIVQGLPRIEEILEARKKNLAIKRIPKSQKNGLLVQVTSLDSNFEFKKLGTLIKENDKVNPHRLLKVYFNYYGIKKSFLCDQEQIATKSGRLVDNYEGSYKSFKKVQAFILNSVQAIYKSQGVSINDKHLEVIIKQMTTKVIITYEGNSPLLKREVIDLYHIKYINDILKTEAKQKAYYVPLLLGISKAALNNPSFISAASFQETTRVLTRAAIEGRIDWFRGLKENIIIGQLIPAGTGSRTYRNSFRKIKTERNQKVLNKSNTRA